MKKLVSVLLACMFFLLAMPLNVLAEALNPLPTGQELSAALAITGLTDDAPGYHIGMDPEYSMNAMQLTGWINDFQKNQLCYILDSFENYDVALYDIRESQPLAYETLKNNCGSGIDMLYEEYSYAKAWQDEVNYYAERLPILAAEIYNIADAIQGEENLSERDQVIFAYEMRAKWQELKQLMEEAVDRSTDWDRLYTHYDRLLNVPDVNADRQESVYWLMDTMDSMRGQDGRAARAMTVSASAVRVAPDQTVATRLARLSPISSALADSDQKMIVKILDDKNFGITVVDGDTRVSGASVTVYETGKTEYQQTADSTGSVMFPIRNFQNDAEGETMLNIKISASGYRRLEAPGVWLKKGKAMSIPLEKDDGKPYLVSWSFWDHDMKISKYSLITSPLNDSRQPISLKVSSPADYHLKVYFTDKNDANAVTVGEGNGKKGEQSFTFEDQWLMKVPAEGKLYAEITWNGQTEKYQAQLELKASVLKKPLGDPNTKFVMTPGFQIKLPDGWVTPFGGMTISLNLPLAEKYQLRGYFDINGSGALTMGTTILGDMTKKMTENWKTQDQKALEKAAKEAKGKGYMAETKAKNGGDWAGRSKWKPLKLGAISFDISFFAFVQVQYSEDGYDYGQIFGKGGAGFTATLKGSYTLMWPLASLGAFVSATFTVFPEIAVMVDTYWPSGAMFPEFKRFEYAKGALNIILRIEIGVEACLGLKGIASISIRGVGFLEFVFRAGATFDLDDIVDEYKKTGSIDIAKRRETDVKFEIYAGGSVDVILEIFWAKATYAILNPPAKFMLYPERKRISENKPADLVQRFIASLLSSAQAAEEDAPQEGGGQVDTGNNDLAVQGSLIDTKNTHIGKAVVVKMRAAGSNAAQMHFSDINQSAPVPILLYIDQSYTPYNGEAYKRPILVSVPVSAAHYKDHPFQDNLYQPLLCQNGQTGELQDHYLPQDGYDVIDFDCWVADVSSQNVTTYVEGYGDLKLSDVLFTVCILAKDYHEETETLNDGSRRTVKVPDRTWAYVSCYCYDGRNLRHVILPQEKETNNYLAMCYPLEDGEKHDPSEQPRIAGMLRKRYGDESALLYQYSVVTNAQGVENMGQKTGYAFGDVVYANYSYAKRLERAADNKARSIGRLDGYMANNRYVDYQYFQRDDDSFLRFYLTENKSSRSDVYDLVYGHNKANAVGSFPGMITEGGMAVASGVISMVARDPAAKNPYIFFLQQAEDGAGYRLMGCQITAEYPQYGYYYWNLRDYDLDMPRTDLHWSKLYGRECLYWMETAGQTEDGSANLFKIRALWYDDTADAFSEPFVIAMLKTAADASPEDIYLAGNNEGYYFLRQKDGNKRLFRFSFQFVPGLKMVGNVLTDTLANPGSYDDMLLTVFNNGNLPLTGFDLVAYHEAEGKQAEAFETIHLDILNPSKNTITLRKGLNGGTEQRSGESVARAENSSLNVDGAEYRYGITKWIWSNGPKVLEERRDLMKPNMLMPNTFKAFNISLLIPQDWEGNHSIYLEVDRYYVSNGSSFQKNVNGNSNGTVRLLAAIPQDDIISIGRDGTVRKENSGGMLLFAAIDSVQKESEEDFSMYKSDVTFDRIRLNTSVQDLDIQAVRWDNDGEPMVTLTVTNWAHIGSASRTANAVVMEAYLDDETAPVFRYSLPDEVSDKETWNFDLPLSLLTDGRSASKVTVKIKGKNYKEVGDVDNSAVILLDTDALSFLTQPDDVSAPIGSPAVFHAAVIGGRSPYKFQWQMRTSKGSWEDLPCETAAALTLKAVTLDISGNQYRVIVTDASDYTVTSRAATLTVKKVPNTGDDAPVIWWIGGTAIALMGIAYVIIKRKKEQHEKTV